MTLWRSLVSLQAVEQLFWELWSEACKAHQLAGGQPVKFSELHPSQSWLV